MSEAQIDDLSVCITLSLIGVGVAENNAREKKMWQPSLQDIQLTVGTFMLGKASMALWALDLNSVWYLI